MWLIPEDNITAVVVDEDHPSFPKESLQNDYINDKWKGLSVDAQITLTVSSGDTVAIFGTNATTITMNKGGALTVESNTTLGCAVAYYTADAGSHNITINLTAPSGFVECGKVIAGDRLSFIDPQYGMTQGWKNTNIVKELQTGSYYTKKRNMPRTFDIQIDEERDSDFYSFMRTYYANKGPEPCCWRLNDTLTSLEWLVYACMPEPPTGTHAYYSHSTIGFSLTENL